jgi:excisionase family DNA binding protein
MGPEVLTAREAAAILRVGRNQLYQAVARGQLGAIRIGRSIRGNLQRKCVKAHPKAAGKCSSRCVRWYPRLELPRGPDGTRRFEALGGYPNRAQAEAALADALARRSHGFLPDPAKLTVNQYLARWLTHIRTNRRARTVARYTALLRDTSDPPSAPGRSSNSPRWRFRPSTTGWPSAAAGTASRAGWPLNTSWRCTAACTAPWPKRSPGGSSRTTRPPTPPHHRSPAPM